MLQIVFVHLSYRFLGPPLEDESTMSNESNEERRWEDLLANPREEVHRELKSWLDLSDNADRANLAKATLAMANSGGGQVIIGFEEDSGSWQVDSSRPQSIEHYDQDEINGIVQRFADPPFHCEVYHVEHPDTGDLFPVIDVPGGSSVPVRAKRGGPDGRHVTHNEYYIRRPGPESAPPQTAREWDELLRRCLSASRDDLLDRIRNILVGIDAPRSGGADEWAGKLEEWTDSSVEVWQERVEESYEGLDASPYRHGYWTFSYSIEETFEQPTLPDLKEILREVKGHETGWPPWIVSENDVYPRDETVEAWLVDPERGDPAHADFWRATPLGKLFLLRAYQEDGMDGVDPGMALDIVLPIWRVGECLLHASRLARELCEGDPSISVEIRWHGIEGRTLVSVANRRRDMWGGRQAHQNDLTVKNTFSVVDVEDNLPEVVESLIQPLYQAFDFFDPPAEIYQEELDRMLGT